MLAAPLIGKSDGTARADPTVRRKEHGLKLYYSRNLNPRVAVAVARYLQSPVEFIQASPRDPANEDAFRSINPNTLVPVLVEERGTLWETDAIACRLSMLAGSDFWVSGEKAAEFQMWLSWSAHHFTRAASFFYWEYAMKPRFGFPPASTSEVDEAHAEFHRFAAVLEDFLSNRTWLVGNQLSFADFRVATPLPFANSSKLPIHGYPHILAWHERLCRIGAWENPFQGLA
jgi:glutathione S-transferase